MDFKDPEQRRAYFTAYYHKRKAEYVELLGGKCVKCGAAHDLEFDHVESSSKSFTLTKFMNFSKKKALEELKKCQLLCRECHKKKTRAAMDGGRLLSGGQVAFIRGLYASKMYKQRELAEAFGVHQVTISNAISDRWKF